MASFLKDLSFALGLLTSDQTPVADQYGWKDYIWRLRPVEQCVSPDAGMCMVIADRWDWKRDQHYTFEFEANAETNAIVVRLGLDNRDPTDRDNVCVVALFTDADDREMAIFYQNWTSLPGRSYKRDVPIQLHSRFSVGSIAKVAIGVKQCEQKNAADSSLFYSIRTMLEQR